MLQTVLVVEDDRTMRELLRVHLSAAGYAVNCAANGTEGLQAVRGVTPDLIICDRYMPGMDGFEFLSALKPIPSVRDTPVIMLTVDGEAHERAAQLGAAVCLNKPIRLESLLAAVRNQMAAGKTPKA